MVSLVVGRTNRPPFTRTRTNGAGDERTTTSSSIVIAKLLVHLLLPWGVAASLVEDGNRARPPLGAAGTTTRAKGETGKGRERREKEGGATFIARRKRGKSKQQLRRRSSSFF